MSDIDPETGADLDHVFSENYSMTEREAKLHDEIQRLEAECMNLATHGRVYKRQYEQACQDHAMVMDAIKRLRTALNGINSISSAPSANHYHGLLSAQAIARAALSEPQAASRLPETAGRNADRSGDGIADTLTCRGEGWLTLCLGCAAYRKGAPFSLYRQAPDGSHPCARYTKID